MAHLADPGGESGLKGGKTGLWKADRSTGLEATTGRQKQAECVCEVRESCACGVRSEHSKPLPPAGLGEAWSAGAADPGRAHAGTGRWGRVQSWRPRGAGLKLALVVACYFGQGKLHS